MPGLEEVAEEPGDRRAFGRGLQTADRADTGLDLKRAGTGEDGPAVLQPSFFTFRSGRTRQTAPVASGVEGISELADLVRGPHQRRPDVVTGRPDRTAADQGMSWLSGERNVTPVKDMVYGRRLETLRRRAKSVEFEGG